MKEIKINSKIIGENHPCFIIAQIAGMFSNFDEAKRLVNSAIAANVDAIKFQTYDAETITTKDNLFDLGVTGKISQYESFKKHQLSFELQKKGFIQDELSALDIDSKLDFEISKFLIESGYNY